MSTDYVRPTIQSYEGDDLSFCTDETLLKDLKKLAAQYGTTLYMIILATYNVLLHRYTNQEDLIIGSPVAGRMHPDLEGIVGVFVNTLALRNFPKADQSFSQFLMTVKENTIKAFENQDYQFETLIDKLAIKRDLSRNPLFDTMFVMQNTSYSKESDIKVLSMMPYEYEVNNAMFDLTLNAVEEDKWLKFDFEYCTALFKPETIERMSKHFLQLLKSIVQHPERKISEFNILMPLEEIQILDSFNDTKQAHPYHQTLVAHFEDQVDSTPYHIALLYNDETMTYKALDYKANQVANLLREKGVQPNEFVGIMIERSFEMIIGIIGILKAGAAYMPIGHEYPDERVAFMLQDSKAKILLSSKQLGRTMQYENVATYYLDDSELYKGNGERPVLINTPEDNAYIIYTSGSTGKPKGVVICHKAVVNILYTLQERYPLNEEDAFLLKTAYTFDVSVAELFGWYINGGKLALLNQGDEKIPEKILEAINKYGITHINFVPSMFQLFISILSVEALQTMQSLKYIFLAGEAVTPNIIKRFKKLQLNTRLENIYGPTESTIYATAYNLLDYTDGVNISIGKPLDNITAYIVNEHNMLQPIGVVGELCLGGVGLAKGYLNNETLTNEKFVSNPFEANTRMYRTGDLCQWLPDGNILYLGRLDHQVKVRGFRIEIGEIEQALMDLGFIKSVVVMAIEENTGEKALCAYYTADETLEISEIREKLGVRLPDYMIPSYFIKLDAIPLNQSGKVDRKALPRPTEYMKNNAVYIAPENEIEADLVELWKEILNVEQIGTENDFFESGGHSLKAALLLSKIHKAFNVKLELRDLFTYTTIKKLAGRIAQVTQRDYLSVEKAEERAYYPLTSTQRRQFILNQIDDNDISYNLPVTIKIEGQLDKIKLEKAIDELVARHDVLRTYFEVINDEPVAKIADEVNVPIQYVQVDEKYLEEKVNDFVKPFDLAHAPLMRVGIFEYGMNQYVLVIDLHHIISDGTSIDILIEEFVALYKGEKLPENKIGYKDFAIWQTEKANNEQLEEQGAYWLKMFENDIPVLNLPTDYTRPTRQVYEGDNVYFETSKELATQIYQLAQQTGTTLYMVLLAAYNTLLYRYTGQEDIVIGSPIAGRTHEEVENVVGMFVNTLALRNQPQGKQSFEALLNQVKETTLEAYKNQEYPFEQLVDRLDIKRDLSRNPLFDTMLILQNTKGANKIYVEVQDLVIQPFEYDNKTSKFDISLDAIEEDDVIKFRFEYCVKLFKKSTMERMAGHFLNILASICNNTDILLEEIDLLKACERAQILEEFNNTAAPYEKEKTIHQLFEEQVARTPQYPAVRVGEDYLTYEQLNNRVNRIAYLLREKGIKPNDVVGIMLERSFEMIVGVMGILKAGAAYLPIAPHFPEERIKYMFENSKAKLVLVQERFSKTKDYDLEEIILDDETLYEGTWDNPEYVNTSRDMAYIIYTSGSTGRPKGVMIEHYSVINRINWMNKMYPIDEKDVILQKTPYTFDVSVWELFWWSFTGASVYMLQPEGEKDPEIIAEAIVKHNITTMHFVPSMLNIFLDYIADKYDTIDFSRLKQVFASGEALSPLHTQKFREYLYANYGTKLHNLYGPTEATVDVSYFDCMASAQNKVVPIGKPIDNINLLVVDKLNHLQPIGIAGELCIAGDGLARGYINNEDLTNEKFIENPYKPGTKMYRTGDLVRWMNDGNIEYLGRIDFQVKIRGFRIELGEIENELLAVESIKEAVVIAIEEAQNEKVLCAYFVGDETLTVSQLRSALSKNLPEYMLPAYFIRIDKMPLSANGKLDRKALPKPQEHISTGADYTAPENEVELKLVAIWERILGIEKVGTTDSFFELGGHSLKATVLVSNIAEQFNVKIPLREIFNHTTIKELANYIMSCKQCSYTAIKPADIKPYYPLSSAQKRLYILEQFETDSIAYNVPIMVEMQGALGTLKLKQIFETLVHRYEVLRTSIHTVDGQPVQVIHENLEVEISQYEANTTQQQEEIMTRFIQPFDLQKAPLMHVGTMKMQNGNTMLMIDLHHIITDGVSNQLLIQDFINLYTGKALKPVKVQYKDYVMWQQTEAVRKQLQLDEVYWLERLSGEMPVLDLPTDYTRPAVQSFEGDSINFRLSSKVAESLESLASNTKTTMYMILLAAYNVLLHKYTGQEDILIGSPIAGRVHADLQDVIGMFVNTLVMRNQPEGSKPFNVFLDEVKESTLAAYEHQNYQFEELVDKLHLRRDLSRNPVFDTMFVLQNTGVEEVVTLEDVNLSVQDAKTNMAKFDLNIIATQEEGTILFEIEYSTKLFKKETIERLASHFNKLLENIAEVPTQSIASLEMISKEETDKILNDFNATHTVYPATQTIIELFEEQVAAKPNHIAVVDEVQSLNYKELQQRVNSLAAVLLEKGIKQGELVGLIASRNVEMIIGTLAILKAGGAYLPIDTKYPVERINYMLKDGEVKLLLTDNGLKEQVVFEGQMIDLTDKLLYTLNMPIHKVQNTPDDLAYVIYTSGSTGQPKGVMVTQRNVVRLVKNTKYIAFTAQDRILQTGAIVFDASTFEIWGALLNGLSLYLVRDEILLNARRLEEAIQKYEITIMWLTAPLFMQLVQDRPAMFKCMKYLLVGGDVVSAKHANLVRKNAPGLQMLNGYGPTENTTFSTVYPIEKDYESNIPIGKPISNSTAYVVDTKGRLQPIGVPGELWVGGDGVAKGYLNKPELTAEKFIDNPFGEGKVYKSGDLVRWLEDGNIEFMGRIDQQVKIRGFRIEIGEIEKELVKIQAVQEAIVIAVGTESSEKALCAYFTATYEVTANDLRNQLAKKLPEYMLPSYYMQLSQMPLNRNGKVDRKALPKPDGESIINNSTYMAPANKIENELVQLWQDVLKVERVGIIDNFFGLGGHSLKAMLLIGEIYKHFNVEMTIKTLFAAQTVKEQAAYIQKAVKKDYEVIEKIIQETYYPLSSAQKRIYVVNSLMPDSTAYNVPFTGIIEGKLEKEMLEQAFNKLIQRHEALRTSFMLVDGQPMQQIAEKVDFSLAYEEASDEELDIIIEHMIEPFDLSCAPLIRSKLVKLGEEKYAIIIDLHHIITDATSMNILIGELLELYKGESLEPLEIQYKDFATWQNKLLQSEAIKKQEAYWLNYLSGEIPVLNLPTDYNLMTEQNHEGKQIDFTIDQEIQDGLKAINKQTGSTMYMTLLAAYNVLLAKYTGQDDIIVGSPIAGRNHPEINQVVGIFINTLAIRNYPQGKKSFNTFLNEVKENVLGAFENQDYQFEELIEKLDIKRDLNRNPLFDTLFAMENTSNSQLQTQEFTVESYELDNKSSKFYITLHASEKDDEMYFDFEYSTQLFKAETIERMIKHFKQILRCIIANPSVTLDEINLVTAEEEQQILSDFNKVYKPYNMQQSILECIERQVEVGPNQIAVVYEKQMLTYSELNSRANQLAHYLMKQSIKAPIIGIMAKSSVELIIGMLAILKTGNSYLPISPEFPEERIQYMLDDSKVTVLITVDDEVPNVSSLVTCININSPEISEEFADNLQVDIKKEDLMYIIYTSGTTGQPKGVQIQHQNVVNYMTWFVSKYEINNMDKTALVSSASFDLGYTALYSALISGSTLHMTDKALYSDPEQILDYIEAAQITYIKLTPSLFKAIVSTQSFKEGQKCQSLRLIVLGGEKFDVEDVEKYHSYYPNTQFVNHYGPTETTIGCITHSIDFNEYKLFKAQPVIGRPIDNVTAYIVNNSNKLQPIGVPGQLVISGYGLSKGYMNKPELTNQKFVANPYLPGEKMYLTGDLAKWMPNGTISFIGRMDEQVKIRGYRVEIGEIEAALKQYVGIKDVIVMVYTGNNEEKSLCAYYVSEEYIDISDLRAMLTKHLPEYMLPSYYIRIDRVPLTANGKVATRELPEPTEAVGKEVAYVAPENEIEEKLLELWQQILGSKHIGIIHNFFEVGGHSLKGIVLTAEIYKVFECKISLKQIFEFPTIKQQAQYIKESGKEEFIEITKAKEAEYYPLSSAQKRVYALSQFDKDNTNYNMPAIYVLKGKLDVAQVESIFEILINRHEALRTSFHLEGQQPVQRIHEHVTFKVEEFNVAENTDLNSLVYKEIERKFIRPFDLTKVPLIRVGVAKLGQDKMLLMYDKHHIISDGVSRSILLEEFMKLYSGESLSDMRLQYKDFAVWQNQLFKTALMQKQKDYWLNVFSDELPVLSMPTDYSRPLVKTFEGKTINYAVPSTLYKALKKLALETETTLYMICMAAYNILLSKYTNQEDIIIGTPTAGRQHADLQNIVGMFVNTLAIRSYPRKDMTFNEFLKQVKQNILGAFENQDYQFEELIENLNLPRDLSRNPLFDTMFVMQNTGAEEIETRDIIAKAVSFDYTISKFDFMLVVTSCKEELEINLEYSTKLFKESTMQQFLMRYMMVLENIVKQSEIRLGNISVLSDAEEEKILYAFNNTKQEYLRSQSIMEIFDEQVNKTPDAVAVVYERESLTYSILQQKVNALAYALRQNGVKREDLVGLIAKRSIEMIIGTLAILKAGAAYVPIDAKYPVERINYMLKDADTQVVLTDSGLKEGVLFNGTVIDLMTFDYESAESENIVAINAAEDLAYVIYTSGSTGQPKGVMVTHRNIIRLVKNTNYVTFNQEDHMLQTGAIVFDASTFEIWGALLNGLSLYLISDTVLLNSKMLEEAIKEYGITTMWLTAPLFMQLVQERPAMFNGVKYLIIGGDVVSAKHANLARKYAPNMQLLNGYGPTENTTFSTTYPIEKDFESNIPIGKPITNSTAYVVSEQGKLQPIGVPGELWVGGDGVARGYLNNPELTAEKFINNPFGEGKIYKTGDLVRWLEDGTIEFMGRIDQQVKIRGFRIEIGEIEKELIAISGIKEACVVARGNNSSEKSLYAYFTAEEKMPINVVKKQLSVKLPEYMIPSYFMQIDKMPLNQNGKINKKELPTIDMAIMDEETYVAPTNEIECQVVEIWQEILGIQRIGIHDNFFEIGGHSLKAVLLIGAIRKQFNIEISLSNIFELSTVESLAVYISEAKQIHFEAIEKVPEQPYYELSAAQKRLYIIDNLITDTTDYNVPFTVLITGKLNIEQLNEAFEKLIKRHEILRTVFVQIDGTPYQKVEEQIDFKLDYYEKEEDEVSNFITQLIKPFDLKVAPLMRGAVIKIVEDKYVLFIDIHHIITDGTSLGIFIHELIDLYEGKSLMIAKLQYKDFAAWQNKLLQSDKLKAQEEFWCKEFADEIPVLNLPTDYAVQESKEIKGDRVQFNLDNTVLEELKALAQKTGSTLYMILLAAYNILLYKYTGQEDIVVGTPIAGRNHPDLTNVLGMFVNTIALRNNVIGEKHFTDFLEEVKERSIKAFENQDYQFESLVSKLNVTRDFNRNPLFDTMFTLENTEGVNYDFESLTVEEYQTSHDVAKFFITCHTVEKENGLYVDFAYNANLFKRMTIERMAQHFENIIKAILVEPTLLLDDIQMLSKEEEEHVLAFNTKCYESYEKTTVTKVFEQRVKETPNHIAVVFEGETLTYKALNEKANQVADYLYAQGLVTGEMIGIVTEPSLNMMVGILAILKLGKGYLPIDLSFPKKRIEYMLQDSKVDVLLIPTEKCLAIDEAINQVLIQNLKVDETTCKREDVIYNGADVLYTIYTSGTTGKPKGVSINHNNLLNYINWFMTTFKVTSDDRTVLLSSASFDLGYTLVYSALLGGTQLHIVSRKKYSEPEEILDYIQTQKITYIKGTPSLFNTIVNTHSFDSGNQCDTLRLIVLGGEKINTLDIEKYHAHYEKAQIVNHYGPTETTIGCIAYPIDFENFEEFKGQPVIGRPITNMQAYILNKALKLQPIGIVGEIAICGEGVSNGYRNNSDLTNEKFIENPYNPNYKMYLTGDLGMWTSEGTIKFIGRKDEQVKIRGYRIEVKEVENVIKQYEGIKETLVVVKEHQGEKTLCAYIVPVKTLDINNLRAEIAKSLPNYMHPSYYIQLDQIPLTPNGKVDYKALPALAEDHLIMNTEYVLPDNEIEHELLRIWQQVLGIHKIGTKHNFFEIGGHSLKAVVLSAQIFKAFHMEIPLRKIFDLPTIKEQAHYIQNGSNTVYTNIEKAAVAPDYPMSSAQKRMYALNQLVTESTNYNMPSVYLVEGQLDMKRLEESFETLVQRHESLRTSFHMVEDKPIQVIHEDIAFKVEHIAVEKPIEIQSEKGIKAVKAICKEFIRPFDLSKAPLFRAGVAKIDENQYILMDDKHHIISDGVSRGILLKELMMIYNGQTLSALRIQYKDFAVWQNKLFEQGIIQKQEAYWLKQFEGELPVLNLPLDYQRPAIKQFEGDTIKLEIPHTLYEALKDLALKTNTTLYMVLMATYNMLLYKYTGQEDIIVGTPTAGRTDSDLQNIVGMFVNTLAIRNKISGEITFNEFFK
ncbi:non-ribosomal peptide synthetase [Cellulosilyticum ruminicola]|uniref:non-ribosomal peptide synthetase n=1 Tax=Cellulosilyticum ruminicola TaxID=425254 RepID=UPI0006CFD80B|nr:non-ribosomal peptide synthetase [Cellulosilyticum ruminicola]